MRSPTVKSPPPANVHYFTPTRDFIAVENQVLTDLSLQDRIPFMERKEIIPDDLKRFILTSINSIPHLEAILLLRYDPNIKWDAKTMAQRLYINEKKAAEILADLCSSGFCDPQELEHGHFYSYNPISLELKDIIDRLSELYSKNLIEVTNLIHSKTHKQAQQFGDAFKWQKEKE